MTWLLLPKVHRLTMATPRGAADRIPPAAAEAWMNELFRFVQQATQTCSRRIAWYVLETMQ
jgi:hypothetical protein